MKKVSLFFCLAVILNIAHAQIPPQAFNYSAVARDPAGVPIANSTIGLQMSILKTSVNGNIMYSENHVSTTDEFGLFNLVIGGGSVQSGSMNSIDWSSDNYFLRVGMDASGGTNFITMGTTQLLSVPYALHAKTAETVLSPGGGNDNQQLSVSLTGDTLKLQNGGHVIIPGISTYNSPLLPTISTGSMSAIGSLTATVQVLVPYVSHNTTINEKGICWSTNPNPTLADNFDSCGTLHGNFFGTMTGLLPSTTYYVRGYAINNAGLAYSNEISFTTIAGGVASPGAGVTFHGYTYASTILGNGQEWMAENLRTTKYANGDSIPRIYSQAQIHDSTNTGYQLFYLNLNNEAIYGRLYNSYTIADPRNVCPTGWHVPSQVEWESMINYLGGGSVASNALRSVGTQFWNSNSGATNESNFSALPGGEYKLLGSGSPIFDGIGLYGSFLTSTSLSTYIAVSYRIQVNTIYSFNVYKNELSSIRCLKD